MTALTIPSQVKKCNETKRDMNDYLDFPPIGEFKRVLNLAPKSCLIFCNLYKHIDRNNRVIVPQKEVKKKFLISPTLLRNHLLQLARLDILTFEETKDFFLIDFIEND